jgi:hypothetical protein
MNKAILIILVGLALIGCNKYKNKSRYELPVKEKVSIYYTTNSCCYYCISNESKLKHIKLVERKTIDPVASDCEGCDYTAAFVFEGIAIGRDTLELKLLGGRMDCNSNDVQPEKYIIEVK